MYKRKGIIISGQSSGEDMGKGDSQSRLLAAVQRQQDAEAGLYHSHQTKLHLDATLSELRPSPGTYAEVDKSLHALKKVLESVHAEHGVKTMSTKAAKALIKTYGKLPSQLSGIPFLANGLSDIRDQAELGAGKLFKLFPPAKFHLLGSHLLRTSIYEDALNSMSADMHMELDAQMFRKKDTMNFRALDKQSLFLMKTAELIKDFSDESSGIEVDGVVLRPTMSATDLRVPCVSVVKYCLEVSLKGLSVPMTVRIHCGCVDHSALDWKRVTTPYASLRVPIGKSDSDRVYCEHMKGLVAEEHVGLHVQQSEDGEFCNIFVPSYNRAVLSELFSVPITRICHHYLQSAPTLVDAICLMKLWLKQYETDTVLSGDALTMLVVAMLANGRIVSRHISAMQFFSVILSWIQETGPKQLIGSSMEKTISDVLRSDSDSDDEDIPDDSASDDENDAIENALMEDEMLEAAGVAEDCVVLVHQRFGKAHFMFNIFEGMSQYKWRWLQVVAQHTQSCLSFVDETCGFAAVFLQKKPKWAQFDSLLCLSGKEVFSGRILELLHKALENRCQAICDIQESADQLVIGLIHSRDGPGTSDRSTVDSLVVEGPDPKAEDEVDAFKALWGPRAELRRFRDGRMCWCVVFNEAQNRSIRYTLPSAIAKYIVSVHCPGVHFSTYDAFRKSFDERTSLVFEGVHPKFQALYNALMALPPKPLRVMSCFSTSATMRRTAPHGVGEPIDVYVQLESSNAWPVYSASDVKDRESVLEAQKHLRMSLLCHLIETLQASAESSGTELFELAEPHTDEYVDLFYSDGTVFRLRLDDVSIVHSLVPPLYAGEGLWEDWVSYQAVGKCMNPDNLDSYKQFLSFRMLRMHHEFMKSLAREYPSLPGNIAIAKQWAQCNFLSIVEDGVVNDVLWELLAAAVTTSTAYRSATHSARTPAMFLMSFVRFLAKFDFHNDVIMVESDVSNATESTVSGEKPDESADKPAASLSARILGVIRELRAHAKAKEYQLFITPAYEWELYNRLQNVAPKNASRDYASRVLGFWTQSLPTKAVWSRIVFVAQKNVEWIEKELLNSSASGSDPDGTVKLWTLFQPDLSGYDILIPLERKWFPVQCFTQSEFTVGAVNKSAQQAVVSQQRRFGAKHNEAMSQLEMKVSAHAHIPVPVLPNIAEIVQDRLVSGLSRTFSPVCVVSHNLPAAGVVVSQEKESIFAGVQPYVAVVFKPSALEPSTQLTPAGCLCRCPPSSSDDISMPFDIVSFLGEWKSTLADACADVEKWTLSERVQTLYSEQKRRDRKREKAAGEVTPAKKKAKGGTSAPASEGKKKQKKQKK